MNYSHLQTPVFVLEEAKLIRNLELLNRVIKEADIHLLVALKGFAFWDSFPLIAKYLSGACASSLNEARLIFEEMKCRAHTYCPVYLEEDFDELISYSNYMSFNSLQQWDKYSSRAILNGVSCGLRINPGYSEIDVDLYNPALPGSRLGIDAEHLGDVLPEGTEGLHFHVMCEQDSFVLERILQRVEEKFGKFFSQLKWINMGGGHHITRKGYDVNHLINLLNDFKKRYPHLEVILEPGEAVGWETGFLLSTVRDIVESGGIKTAMLDVSFSAHMPDTLEMPYRPNVVGASEHQTGLYRYRLGGVSCLAGDYMGNYAFDHELQIGEQLIFEDMIHYTMVKTTLFNGVKHPMIGKITVDGEFVLLRQLGYEAYKYRLS